MFISKKIFFTTILLVIISAGFLYAQDSVLDGLYKTYYDTGELHTEQNYLNGKRHGLSIIYDKSGRVITKVKFKNDKIVRAFSAEPERNLGQFEFLKRFTVWISVIIVGVIIWFVLMKVLFKSRPL